MRILDSVRRVAKPASAIAALLGTAGCRTEILNVDTPDVISESSIGGPLGATTLRNGAVQDFFVAFSGTQDGFVVSTGNMADEIQTTDTFADRYNTDGRSQFEQLGGATNTVYNNLHLARTGLASAIQAWTKANKPSTNAVKDSLAEMYALRGLSETFFAEAYCSGVPFSSVNPDGTFAYGDQLKTSDILARATATIDTAIATATGTIANVRNLAAVAKARVLLNQGQFAQAAAAVANVPTSFRYQAFHSTGSARQQNGIYNASWVNGSRYTAGTREGTNGIDYLTSPADPRAPFTANGHTSFDDAARRVPRQEKYPSASSPVTVADGIEARLIEAEAKLNATTGGSQADRDAAFVILNALRTGNTPALAALPVPTTQDEAVNVLFRERALWLWLTGHRLGDMRRLIRQYGRAANTVFPIGPIQFRPGNSYGTDVNFIVPFTERNNPKFTGCLDRNP